MRLDEIDHAIRMLTQAKVYLAPGDIVNQPEEFNKYLHAAEIAVKSVEPAELPQLPPKPCPRCGHDLVPASKIGERGNKLVCPGNMPYQGCGWRQP